MREKQRAELHKTIWSIANELRGSVDGWDFKAYVLITLFYRFISEDITATSAPKNHKALITPHLMMKPRKTPKTR